MTRVPAPVSVSNLLSGLGDGGGDELLTTLIERPGIRIERIVSHGHSTPADTPYDQPWDEWVLLVEGAARLWIEGQDEISLGPGDYLLIPAHRHHRVTWTQPDTPTIWLAVHFGG
jgi:cupin 2 domain-containing protein